MHLLPRDTPELGELQSICKYPLSLGTGVGSVLILLNTRRHMRSLVVGARRISCGSVACARYEYLDIPLWNGFITGDSHQSVTSWTALDIYQTGKADHRRKPTPPPSQLDHTPTKRKRRKQARRSSKWTVVVWSSSSSSLM